MMIGEIDYSDTLGKNFDSKEGKIQYVYGTQMFCDMLINVEDVFVKPCYKNVSSIAIYFIVHVRMQWQTFVGCRDAH